MNASLREQEQHRVPEMVPTINSFDNLAQKSGLYDAINQENFISQQDRLPENYEQQLLGHDSSQQPIHEPDEYDSFIEEEPENLEEKKPTKKFNDSKKRINQLLSKNKLEREQKEQALIRAEIAEREVKRVSDEREFLILSKEKDDLDYKTSQVSQIWAEAHEVGDTSELQQANMALHELGLRKAAKEREIETLANNYIAYQDEQDAEIGDEQELTMKQYEALLEFSDPREMNSTHYKEFLQNHEYLDTFDRENYDAKMVERVEPVKFDLIQELKLNGQANLIGTIDYFKELSSRIHSSLNPRTQQVNQYSRGQNMSNPYNPYNQQQQYPQQQYQQPQQQQPQQQQQYYQQQYPQQQQQQYNQPQYQQQPQQYQQQQYNQQQQYQSVAPVNRAGYANNFSTDARDIQLSDQQQDVINDLFLPSINELSQKVYGRSMDRNEAENLYKTSLAKDNNRR